MCELERCVRLSKANVESMTSIMEGWCKVPLYKRKGDKLLHLEVRIESELCSAWAEGFMKANIQNLN